jgi:hypothetical protein
MALRTFADGTPAVAPAPLEPPAGIYASRKFSGYPAARRRSRIWSGVSPLCAIWACSCATRSGRVARSCCATSGGGRFERSWAASRFAPTVASTTAAATAATEGVQSRKYRKPLVYENKYPGNVPQPTGRSERVPRNDDLECRGAATCLLVAPPPASTIATIANHYGFSPSRKTATRKWGGRFGRMVAQVPSGDGVGGLPATVPAALHHRPALLKNLCSPTPDYLVPKFACSSRQCCL